MKYLRLVPIFSALALCAVQAQRGDPEPIPDFTNFEDFIYEPKTTLTIGMRSVGGAKTSFRGTGIIKAVGEDIGNVTDTNISRGYHDGLVNADTRGSTVDNGDGTFSFVPITPDGKTSSWRFLDERQATAVPGYIAMHSYSASVIDTSARTKDGKGSIGMELAVSRDMGKILGSRFSWSLTAGMTINDINSKSTDRVLANLSTITDLYSLFGEAAPAAGYVAPSTVSTTITDASGNPVLNPDGSTQVVTTDTTVLIGNAPTTRTTTVTTDDTSVSNRSTLKGAYYTFRAGPTIWLPLTQRFRASVSVGAALIYAGSNYSITQTYQPEIGIEITESLAGDTTQFLPGYFADAAMQFDLTARTGIYAGVSLQQSGDYNQTVTTSSANYSTKLEFGRQQGFRAGMTIKF